VPFLRAVPLNHLKATYGLPALPSRHRLAGTPAGRKDLCSPEVQEVRVLDPYGLMGRPILQAREGSFHAVSSGTRLHCTS
jgi:hypothetical protein